MPFVRKAVLYSSALGLGLLLSAGCARDPGTGPRDRVPTLTLRFRMDGPVRTGAEPGSPGLPFVYIIALNVSRDLNPTSDGPLPVVVPGGNGFVAGEATHYILWNPLVSPQYQLYRFRDGTLNEWTLTGTPIDVIDVTQGSNTVGFTIRLSQLVPLAEMDDFNSVQINFLSMNGIQTSGGGRVWDALGDARIPSQVNTVLTVPLKLERTYSNALATQNEPRGDTADPALDIVDWQVEVRSE